MNTALIVEPRDLSRLPIIIHKFQKSLGESWKIVFYCGKGLKERWTPELNSAIEIRELNTTNLKPHEYSDLLKTKDLWLSLYGDYVLVFQADTWIINTGKYTIDFFINKNVSYIGGNMNYPWYEHPFNMPFPNYNGGLSLRKRSDMIKIIESFPPIQTRLQSGANDSIEGMAEDVYFVKGSCNLKMPLGDSDEDFNHFAIHTIFYKEVFGIHQPNHFVKFQLLQVYPDIANAYI